MQSRRDQLQAYKFLTRRALAALVVGEPDVPEAPMRRLSLTTLTGIMVAVLVALVQSGNTTPTGEASGLIAVAGAMVGALGER